MGREDDVLVVNYMTGAKDVFGPQEYKLSNTLNPFSSGSSGGLTELMVSLFVKDGVFQHLGLVIAGPSELKTQIQSDTLFLQQFQKHLKKVMKKSILAPGVKDFVMIREKF